MREELINLQDSQRELEKAKEYLKIQREKLEELYQAENKFIIEKVENLNNTIEESKSIIKVKALEEFEITQQKKLLGGIGIQERKSLDYDPETAYDWAIGHKLCLQLDKKAFESLAKTQRIPFVKEETKILVTFPKEIKLGGEQ